MLGDDGINARTAQPIVRDGGKQLADYRRWYPDTREEPADDTFEIGLVLAGAVSAGAYTAGVMDFLFEALDEWHRCRKEDKNLPQHNVVLRVMSGASAGGINGAIAATACRYSFPPVTLANFDKRGSENPFFNTWVKGIDIGRLLDPSDLKRGGPVRSLLNSESLDALAMGIVGLNGADPEDCGQRKWLADPFKLLLSVTNLRGVPYEVRFSGNTGFGHQMVMHRDYMGFSVPVVDDPEEAVAPDLVPLPRSNSSEDPGWKLLAATALASGAFPVALASRFLSRPGSDYEYRYVFPYAAKRLVYSPPGIESEKTYDFAAVDGGTMNNEPFELAHRELAGFNGRNLRAGEVARRALIMVDPFTDPQQERAVPDGTLLGTFSALFSAFKSQSRFNQIDLSLAEAEDVYSRFMIAPSRNGIKGSRAIASGGLSGFLGFFCEEYRLHDYMLGRENCQRFLRDWFVLPSAHTQTGQCPKESNALFRNWPQVALESEDFKSRSRHRKGHRQIIPLVGRAAIPQALGDWPVRRFAGYEGVRRKIEDRMDAAYGPLATEIVKAFCDGAKCSWLCRVIARGGTRLVWSIRLRRKILGKFEEWINGARDEVNNRARHFVNTDEEG